MTRSAAQAIASPIPTAARLSRQALSAGPALTQLRPHLPDGRPHWDIEPICAALSEQSCPITQSTRYDAIH